MKNEKVPKLRFPEFDEEWKKTTLGKISNYEKGYAFKSKDYTKSGTRIIRVSDLGAEWIKNDNPVFIKNSKSHNYERYRLNKGNIIVTTVGSRPEVIESAVGKAIYIYENNQGLLNQNMLKLIGKETIADFFLMGFLKSLNYKNYIKIIARGNANQSNITVKDLLKFKIFIPHIAEQNKIAKFLSSVEQKIQQLRRKKDLLEEYKKGVMQKLFSQEIRFKNENGEDFPDWEYKELGDISDRITDKNEDEKYDFVLTNSAIEGVVSQTDYFDKSIANKSNLGGYYIVEKDDFVYNPRISSEAPVGPIKRNKLKTGVMSPLYSVFRINEKHLDFFEYFFETTLWHRYMHSVANFGARHDRMNITVGDFQNLPIPVPSVQERDKIANFVNSVSEKLKTLNRKLELAEKFKKGLLQKMFV